MQKSVIKSEQNQKSLRSTAVKYEMAKLFIVKNNVLRKLIISHRQYPESYRHNQTFD